MTKRIEWLDTAKGILIILVVLGHCHTNKIADMIINSFHMIAFFSLSGITFNANRSFKEFIYKKAKSMMVPYLAFSAIFLLYQYAKTLLFAGTRFDLVSGLISVVIPISGRSGTSVYGLWFFPCLFLAEVVYYMILKTCKKTTSGAAILFSVITVACVACHYLSGRTSIISILPFAIASLGLGKVLAEISEQLKRKGILSLTISLIVFIITVGLNYRICGHSVDLSSMSLGCSPLYIIGSVAGTVLIYTLAMILSKQKFLRFLGRDSMYYYGLHYEIIGIAEKILPGGYCKRLEHLQY